MSKQDFLQNVQEFIGAEIYGAKQSDIKMTEDEWRSWIKDESEDHGEEFTGDELDWIIEALDDAGVIAE